MRITFTGTGAANGIPGYFQADRVSEYARVHRGEDVRYRAGAVSDGVLKIDWGPDTFACCERLGMRAKEWTHVFFTHSHDDHFAPREFTSFRRSCRWNTPSRSSMAMPRS